MVTATNKAEKISAKLRTKWNEISKDILSHVQFAVPLLILFVNRTQKIDNIALFNLSNIIHKIFNCISNTSKFSDPMWDFVNVFIVL